MGPLGITTGIILDVKGGLHWYYGGTLTSGLSASLTFLLMIRLLQVGIPVFQGLAIVTGQVGICP